LDALESVSASVVLWLSGIGLRNRGGGGNTEANKAFWVVLAKKKKKLFDICGSFDDDKLYFIGSFYYLL
jgi:hypothetical protein